MSDERIAKARAALLAAGFADASVAVAGHDRSIAVIGHVAIDRLPALAALAPAIRAAGFRYVTLDLDGAET